MQPQPRIVGCEFDACWACGTSRDGVADPTFQSVDTCSTDDGNSNADGVEPIGCETFEQALAARFRCMKCQHVGASVQRIRVKRADALALWRGLLFAASCTRCSYTELYNPEALEGTEAFGMITDRLFDQP